MVYQSVTSFGGSVRAENVTTGGARFILRLPLATPEMASPVDARIDTGDGDPCAETHGPDQIRDRLAPNAESDPVEVVPGETLTVLVVEDEPHLLRLQERLLSRLNIRVLPAGSAAEARRLLESERIDAIVSDVRMPGESGVGLYQWVGEAHPDLADHFLFVTGDPHSPELAPIQNEVEHMILRKPFEMDEYLERVQALLARLRVPECPPAAPTSSAPPAHPGPRP